MKRGIAVLTFCALAIVLYFTASKWAIHHTTLTSDDILREGRKVPFEVAVRRDREVQAMAEMIELPVAILSHGNTVKHTEYSFLTSLFASRGYLVVSIQHDLETDAPMVTRHGEEIVGRRMHYSRGAFNIMFAIEETEFQHNDLSDRGPYHVKSAIQATVERFLDEDDGPTMPLLAASVPALPAPGARKN